jgi:hypothetical protein
MAIVSSLTRSAIACDAAKQFAEKFDFGWRSAGVPITTAFGVMGWSAFSAAIKPFLSAKASAPVAFNASFSANCKAAALSSAWILLLAAASFAAQPAKVPPVDDPAELVRKAVQNEITTAADDNAHFLFRGIKTTPTESTTRLYAETNEATAGLVIAYNGKPLTPEQQKDEEARVQRFIDNPEELRKKRQQEREAADRTMRIMRAIPDAFLFEDAGEVPGTESVGRAGASLVKLNFQPSPHFQPPSRVEEVLTGMTGYVLIDPIHCRIASIDGTLAKPVSFGWGILGHLDRGGRFMVQQQEVGDNLWEISSMTLRFTGKILLFKNLSISSTEVFSAFKRIPSDLTFAQALEMLKKEESSAAAAFSASNH